MQYQKKTDETIVFLSLMLILVSALGIAATILVGSYAYNKGKTEGFEQGQRSIIGFSEPAPSQYELDNMCISWLMQSNLKEAKKRICGK